MGKKEMDRRDFLKSSFTSMGGLIYLSSTEKPLQERSGARKEPEKKMTYRVLGKTGIRMPVITMGVMNTDNPNLVRAALDAGMYHLDTASTYQRGTNEAMIGEVLKGRPRDSFAISTKARLPGDRKTGAIFPEGTENDFTKKIDTSLKHLGLDYIDIYHHHGIQGREGALFEPVLKAFDKAKKAGKIRFIGITTHQNEPEVIRAAIESKVYDVVLPAYNPRQQHVQEVKKAIAEAARAGLGVISMKAIGGRPSGNYPTKTMDIRADLKWPLQDPNVHTVIAGFTTFDQMNLDLEVMKDTTLSQSEKEYLRRAAQAPGLYCQGCGQCLGQCARNLPIPDLMRAYMYVYGYRNLVEAQDLLFSLNLPAELCADCSSCPVKCSNRWNVSTRIRDVARLREVPPDFVA